MARTTWIPALSKNESTLLHLGVSLRYSDGKEGYQTASQPEVNRAPEFVATDLLAIEEAMTYQAEVSFRSGPFWIHGEYVGTKLDMPAYDDPTLDGYHITASWIMTGEVRPYNKRVGIFEPFPVSRTVNQNGWGGWELSTRFSTLDMSEVPGLAATDAGKMDTWSVAINWWLNPYINVNLNYRYNTLDRFGVEGSSESFTSRIYLILE